MLRNLLLLFIVILLGVALVATGFELALRVATNEPKGPIKYQSHPTAVATLKPQLRRKHDDWGQLHYYRTNEAGVRDDGPVCSRPDILIFGDSNVFARFLPFEQTLGEQLENRFDGTVCSANFGVPGYGPDQSLLRMSYEVGRLGLRPQVIVFHVFADNDFGDLFRNHLFTIDDSGKLHETNRDRTDFKLRTLERLQAQYLLVRRFRDVALNTGVYKIPSNEYLPEEVGPPRRPFDSDADALQYLESMEQLTRGEFDHYQNGRYTTWLGDKYDFYLALNPATEAASIAQRLLAGIFRAAKEKSRALNSCFVVLIQPAESDIAETGPISHVDLARYSQALGRNYSPRNLSDLAKQAAESAGVSYINLFDAYKKSTRPVYEHYDVDKGDNHWNGEGVQIAADVLRDYILDSDCLGSRTVAAL